MQLDRRHRAVRVQQVRNARCACNHLRRTQHRCALQWAGCCVRRHRRAVQLRTQLSPGPHRSGHALRHTDIFRSCASQAVPAALHTDMASCSSHARSGAAGSLQRAPVCSWWHQGAGLVMRTVVDGVHAVLEQQGLQNLAEAAAQQGACSTRRTAAAWPPAGAAQAWPVLECWQVPSAEWQPAVLLITL